MKCHPERSGTAAKSKDLHFFKVLKSYISP